MFLEPGSVSGAVNNVFGAAINVFRLQNDCGPANARFLGSERAPQRWLTSQLSSSNAEKVDR